MIELRVDAQFAPKGHCVIERRGVEHAWGVSKMMFRKENTSLDKCKRVNNLKRRAFKITRDIPTWKQHNFIAVELENMSCRALFFSLLTMKTKT